MSFINSIFRPFSKALGKEIKGEKGMGRAGQGKAGQGRAAAIRNFLPDGSCPINQHRAV